MNNLRAWRLAARVLLLAVVVNLLPGQVFAGHVDGPYLLWFNLANDANAERAIHAYTNAQSYYDSCWNDYAVLQAHGLPIGITPDLVRRAVILRRPDAQKRLLGILKHPRGDDVMQAYDGVIVVPGGATPRLMSIGSDGKVSAYPAIDKAGQPAWTVAFCNVLPTILREP